MCYFVYDMLSVYEMMCVILCIINRVVCVLDTDCLKAVVFQTTYHGYDATSRVYCSNYVGNQFIIAIRHLGGLGYMANIPLLRAVSRHSTLAIL